MTRVTARPRIAGPSASTDSAEALLAYPNGQRLRISIDGQRRTIEIADDLRRSPWVVDEDADGLTLEWGGSCCDEADDAHLLAALEAASTRWPGHASLTLAMSPADGAALVRSGLIQLNPGAWPTVSREALWQQPRLWLPAPRDAYPLRYTLTGGHRHPRRPPKHAGTLYQRYIPWLAKTLSFRSVDMAADLPLFHRWMNDPVVAYFWQEQGDLAKHRAHLEAIAADPHVSALIACFDGEPFGYFEVYWAKEDRIAPFYDADDFDRGYHVLVGEAGFRGKPYLTAWMPSISHYLFLDDCRTQRIVIEPRSDNQKMLKSLARCGYAHIKEFDFPHKRAVLGMLLRERFFGDALWIPQPEPEPAHLRPSTLHSL